MPEVTIFVEDQNGNPITGATVSLSNGGGTVPGTNQNGQAILQVSPGSYTIEVLHQNFQTFQDQINVPQNPIDVTVTLNR